ncbi:osteopetrosis-associated transmembrane protein 1 [Electrophorus electricus]|uniref:Osteoclastogenesis associated transmembrane protein 1 n=1 Tax=Electrophorus electricus TaxID=8005 RepID=A0AAY5EII0_ELEEL|nr:osteopetrosis-associated transmembrane protein 1 [Electrophorus electricus]
MGVFVNYACLFRLLLWANALTFITAVNIASDATELSGDRALNRPSSFISVPHAFQPDSFRQFLTLGLSDAFPEDMEGTENCLELLSIFGQRYVTLANCLVSYARPVKVCQNCYTDYNNFENIYKNISSDQSGPGNVSCQDSLLWSDRLMLLPSLYSGLRDIWESAACTNCLTAYQMNLSNETLNFLAKLNQSLICFDKYQQGNHSELCKKCKTAYKQLDELYSKMEGNKTLCIDIEDAMNMTRQLWSKNCSSPRKEMVPVIAVSSFMLFLPIIFYLSNYLHSEQKKRKLIHPKRAKSSHSLMNIQDKFS